MQKVHFIQQKARRQGKRIYRADVDFKNAINAMSQAALWQVMSMLQIPDVDSLEQIMIKSVESKSQRRYSQSSEKLFKR